MFPSRCSERTFVILEMGNQLEHMLLKTSCFLEKCKNAIHLCGVSCMRSFEKDWIFKIEIWHVEFLKLMFNAMRFSARFETLDSFPFSPAEIFWSLLEDCMYLMLEFLLLFSGDVGCVWVSIENEWKLSSPMFSNWLWHTGSDHARFFASRNTWILMSKAAGVFLISFAQCSLFARRISSLLTPPCLPSPVQFSLDAIFHDESRASYAYPSRWRE